MCGPFTGSKSRYVAMLSVFSRLFLAIYQLFSVVPNNGIFWLLMYASLSLPPIRYKLRGMVCGSFTPIFSNLFCLLDAYLFLVACDVQTFIHSNDNDNGLTITHELSSIRFMSNLLCFHLLSTFQCL